MEYAVLTYELPIRGEIDDAAGIFGDGEEGLEGSMTYQLLVEGELLFDLERSRGHECTTKFTMDVQAELNTVETAEGMEMNLEMNFGLSGTAAAHETWTYEDSDER